MTSRGEAGAAAETSALEYFEQRGWKCLARNYRGVAGELDLVLEDPSRVVVFVEVRYRKSSDFGSAQATVDRRKQAKIVKTALQFVKHQRLAGRDLRFDVAAVTPSGVEHIPNAFSTDRYTL